jgi:phosphopantothenoylcysteine decarboxylase/phosphopantothenate--cysteine ligase
LDVKMNTPIKNKHILLGITGSIACYKAVDLASKLTQQGAIVNCILTPAATQFITPLSFQSVTGQRTYVESDLWGNEGHIQHIGLGLSADLLVIAPASANTIAKLAHGFADNLLTITALAARCPLLVAPAMDGGMYSHPATQQNLEMLRERDVILVGPVEGRMASGLVGLGRMVEPTDLLGYIRFQLSRNGALSNKSIVVTAGGTAEPIDPVRSITNRSSGKQGFAIAQAALDLGAEVTLIVGISDLPVPPGIKVIHTNTATEMHTAVMENIQKKDALVMAAAVADFQPTHFASQKLKKKDGIPVIELSLAPDILKAVSEYHRMTGYPKVVVGFAAESQDLIANARQKLESKNLDMIVANDISSSNSGFSTDSNQVIIITSEKIEELPLLQKEEVARLLMDRISHLLDKR